MTQDQIVVNETNHFVYRVKISGKHPEREDIARIVRSELQHFKPQETQRKSSTTFSFHQNETEFTVQRVDASDLLTESIYECFIKTLENSPSYQGRQQIRLAAFLSMIAAWRDAPESNRSHVSTKKWLKEMSDEMMSLLKQETLKSGFKWKNKTPTLLLNWVKEFIEELDKTGISEKIPVPQKDKYQLRIDESNLSPYAWLPDELHMEKFLRCKKNVCDSPKVALETFTSYITCLTKHQKSQRYQELDFGLEDLIHELPNYHTQFWEFIKQESLPRWIEVLSQLATMVVECHYGLERIAPSPRHICMILEIFSIQDTLYRMLDNRYRTFYFDMSPIEKLLEDPYIDMESCLIPINLSIRHLHQPSPQASKPIRFTSVFLADLENSTLPYRFDKELLQRLCPERLEEGYKDLGQNVTLPVEFVHLRQTYILLQMILAPTRTLFTKTLQDIQLINTKKEPICISSEQQTDLEEAPYKKNHQTIINRLLSIHGPVVLSVTEDDKGCPFIKINPWGLLFLDMEDPLVSGESATSRFSFKHPYIYEELGATITDYDFAHHLFNRRVSLMNDGRVDIGGRPLPRTTLTAYRHVGAQGLTQRTIMEESVSINGLPKDISIEMQLINVGYRTIIQETVGKLSKHYPLLYRSSHAPLWHRLVKRNIFGFSALFRMINHEPETLCLILQILYKSLVQSWASDPERPFLYLFDLCDCMSLFIRQSFDENLVPPGKTTWQADPQIEKELKVLNQWLDTYHQKMEASLDPSSKERVFSPETHTQLLMQILLRYERLQHLNLHAFSKPPPITNDELEKILLHFFRLNSITYPNSASRLDIENIQYFLYRLGPRIANWLSAQKEVQLLCNRVLQEIILENTDEARVWNWDTVSPVFSSDPYLIDFNKCFLWSEKERTCRLPLSVLKMQEIEILRRITSEPLEEVVTTTCPVVRGDVRGEQFCYSSVDYSGKNLSVRITHIPNHSLSLYIKTAVVDDKNEHWYSYQPNFFSLDHNVQQDGLMDEIASLTYFVRRDSKQAILITPEGEMKYAVELSSGADYKMIGIQAIDREPLILSPQYLIKPRTIVSKATPISKCKHASLHLKRMEPLVLTDVLCNETSPPGEWDSTIHKLADCIPFYSKYIHYTENFCSRKHEHTPWGLLNQGESHSDYRNCISRFLVVVDTNTQEVGICLGSLKDMDCEFDQFVSLYHKQAKGHGVLLSIYNLDISCVDSGERWEELSPQLQTRIMTQIVQIKFLNGDTYYYDPKNPSLKEASSIPVDSPNLSLLNAYTPLTRWLENYRGDLTKLEYSVHKYIRQHRESLKYGGSSLERAFKEVNNIPIPVQD